MGLGSDVSDDLLGDLATLPTIAQPTARCRDEAIALYLYDTLVPVFRA